MSARKRQGVRPTHDWELLLPLFEWPEQEDYEAIRPLVLSHILVLSASMRRHTLSRPPWRPERLHVSAAPSPRSHSL